MSYIVADSELSSIITDFENFCEYIKNNDIVLSAKEEFLSKKILLDINSKLLMPKDISKSDFSQKYYSKIDLFYYLALSGKLVHKKISSKGKILLTKTKRLDEYERLNIYEKFEFLLRTYYIDIDFEYFFSNLLKINLSGVNRLFNEFSDKKVGQIIERSSLDNEFGIGTLVDKLEIFIKHVSYFGSWEYDENKKYLTINEFGINMSKILSKVNIEDWNLLILRKFFGNNVLPGIKNQFINMLEKEVLEIEDMETDQELEAEKFNQILQPIFKNGVFNKTVTVLDEIKGAYYNFKVSLSSKIWRKIKLSAEDTLFDFSNVILKAFEFEDDCHLYSFFMDGKIYSENRYNSRLGEDGPFVDEVKICDAGFYVGKKVLYLFDYGDKWKFDIVVDEITDEGVRIFEPQILESVGESPEQYKKEIFAN